MSDAGKNIDDMARCAYCGEWPVDGLAVCASHKWMQTGATVSRCLGGTADGKPCAWPPHHSGSCASTPPGTAAALAQVTEEARAEEPALPGDTCVLVDGPALPASIEEAIDAFELAAIDFGESSDETTMATEKAMDELGVALRAAIRAELDAAEQRAVADADAGWIERERYLASIRGDNVTLTDPAPSGVSAPHRGADAGKGPDAASTVAPVAPTCASPSPSSSLTGLAARGPSMDVCGVQAAKWSGLPRAERSRLVAELPDDVVYVTPGSLVPCPGCGAAAGEPCRETLVTALDAARALADEEAIRATTDVCACGHPKREHVLGFYHCVASDDCRCRGFDAVPPDNEPAVDVGLLRAQRDAALVQLDALRAELAAERERCTVACGALVVAQAAVVEGNLRFEARLDDLHVAIDQRDEARARAEAFERDFADAAGELLVDIRDCRPGTVASKLLAANVMMRRELAALRPTPRSAIPPGHCERCDADPCVCHEAGLP